MARGVTGFEQWLHLARYSPDTITVYSHYARRAEVFAKAHGQSLTRATTDVLRAWWDTLPASTATRRNARKALVAYYRSLGRRLNPAEDIPSIRQPKGKPRPYASKDHLTLIAAAHELGGIHEVTALLWATTGARFSEVRKARREQFDLHGLEWTCVGKGVGLQGPKERILPLHSLVAPIVRCWFLESGSPDYLFPAQGPSSVPYIGTRKLREIFHEVLDAAGLPHSIVPHRVRHTWATDALERGVDLRAIQEILGHESLGTTQIYTEVRIEMMRAAVEGGAA
jgi:integrase/recombinase XerD